MLNEKQEIVVNEIERNVLLLASAGTGKTNTLAERIKNILANDRAIAKEILCVTFTNKACKEMKDRIVALAGDNAKDVVVKTFHSLCFDIIKSEAKRNTDIHTGFTIYDEDDCLDVMHEFLEENISAKDIKLMVDYIRRETIANGLFSSNKESDYAKVVEITSKNENKMDEFLSSFRHNSDAMRRVFQMYGVKYTQLYIEILRKNGAIDFQDLMNLTCELFLDKSVVDRYAAKYKFINIDEMQDTSIVEYSIIEKIFKDNNILLCGDNFQTIYEWRGSNPTEIFKKFKGDYNPLEIIFDCNYRATRTLTECSTNFLKNAFPDEVNKLFKNGLNSFSHEIGEKVLFHEASDIENESKWIYNKISELPEEERNDVCILTRNNNYNILLSSNLRDIAEKKNSEDKILDFALIDDSKFFRKPEIKDVLAFLKLTANNSDATALKRIINKISYRIGEATLAKVESTEYKENGILLTDLIDKDALNNNDKFETLIRELDNDNVIVFDVESTGTDTTRDEIIQIAAIRIDSKGNEIERFMKFLKTDKPVGTSEVVHGFSDEFLKENGEDKEKTLLEFLDFIKGKVIVGHNVQYDINILTSELSRKCLPNTEFLTFYDTLDLYRRFYPTFDNHKLDTISKIVKTKHTPNHNALYDILATGEILVHVVDNNVRPTAAKRKELMEKVPDRFDLVAEDMNNLFNASKGRRPNEIIQMVIKSFDILSIFGPDSQQSNNLRELFFVAKLHDDLNLSPRDSLLDFVKITALSDGEMEKVLLKKGKTPIITIHQAKGLEFKHVFLAGMQDYIFPNYHSLANNEYGEEKRVFYVAITRAKKRLYMSYSKVKNGRTQRKSMLLRYIDSKFIIND